jgi:RND family efflux transporter MFP subunit
MRKNKLLYLIVGIVIAIILVFVILRTSGTKSRRQADLTIIPVSKRDINSTILATGSIKPMVGAEVKVGCRISGKVERLYANIGDWIEKDKIIAEIEKQDLEAQVAQKTAALVAAGAKLLTLEHQQPKEIELTKTELKVAESNLQALEHQRPREIEIAKANVSGAGSSLWPGLYGEVGSGYSGTIKNMQENVSAGVKLSLPLFSRSNYSNIKKAKKELELTETKYDDKSKIAATEIEQAKLRLELAETNYPDELKIAQADIEQARAALNYAEIQLSYATIKAPISGVIASITTQEGENVAVGLSAPTFVTIVDLSRLQVDVFVDETDIGKVKVGQGATFTVDAYPGKEFSGKVIAIYPKAITQQNVVYYDVVIAINDTEGLLRPDMTASVTIYAVKRENVLTVPNRAIRREEGKRYVYTAADNVISKREVKVGFRDSNYTEIVEGLKEGERVILGEVEPGKTIEEDKLPPGIR